MMENNEARFHEKLESLEAGRPVEDCRNDLPQEDAELLELASTLRAFQPPARKTDTIAAQIAQVSAAAQHPTAANKQPTTRPGFAQRFAVRPSWFLPAASAVGALVLTFLCLGTIMAILSAGRMVTGITGRLTPGTASVEEARGLVEHLESGGTWERLAENAKLESGAYLRTAGLSSALIRLPDGSEMRLGANTEVVLEQMEHSTRGDRLIRITQWQGQTQHAVAEAMRPGSRYEVRTPAGTAAAKGTAFTVAVDEARQARVNVTEGVVDISGAGKTVPVPAGKTTTFSASQPPADPGLLVSGEGVLTLADGEAFIAGQPVALSDASAWKSGELVAFEGRQMADGTLQVDAIQSIGAPDTSRFRMTGTLDALADTALVAGGAVIQMAPGARIPDGLSTGQNVTVEGAVLADGTLLAAQVYSESDSQPFQFTGVVESIGDSAWIISGITVRVDANTLIGKGIETGAIVDVQGWEENGWLASSILPSLGTDASFDITGRVNDTEPWIIDEVTLEVRGWTVIDETLETGDQARARGAILTDGTWVAASIERVPEETPKEDITLEFVGTVNGTEPWVVSGIALVVDDTTTIEGLVETGTQVRVRATRLPDGTWHADSIVEIEPVGKGCVTYTSKITAVEGTQIILENGTAIDIDTVERVEGGIAVGSTVLVTQCMAADGTVTYPLIKVLEGPGGTPTPTATFTPTITATPLPSSSILPNCYKITFLGMTENGDGTSTWRYAVEELACAQDLSNWMVELPACAQIVDASPSPWEAVNPDPNHQMNGIKWQTGAGFSRGEFSVTLSGKLTTGMTRVGAKGPDVEVGSIAGPMCDLGTVTPTLAPTVTLTPAMTLPATATVVVPTATTAPVQPTSPPPSGPVLSGPLEVRDNGQYVVANCGGMPVTVTGNSNTVILSGSCPSLTVRGNANRITVPGGTAITNTGNENVITQQ